MPTANVEVNLMFTPVYEKTDAYFTVKNETTGGRVSLRIPALQIDNNYL